MNLRAFLRDPLNGPFALLAIGAAAGGFALYGLIQTILIGAIYPILDALVGLNPGEALIIVDDSPANLQIVHLGSIYTEIISIVIIWLIVLNLFPILWARYMDATVECPFCLADVPAEALKCRHCGSDLPLEEEAAAP